MNFVLLINLTLLKTEHVFLLNIVEHENFSTNKYENANKGVTMRIIFFLCISVFRVASRPRVKLVDSKSALNPGSLFYCPF